MIKNHIKIPFIEFNQPIGPFYLSKMKASKLIEKVDIKSRGESTEAVQREQSVQRINEIALYCSDPDATFPTPIIISVYDRQNVEILDNTFIIYEGKIGQVLDGQHRIKGIQKSGLADRFELPVIFVFDLIPEEEAYIFSIINSKQTKVSMSLIYDLFALSKSRSPQKTIHELARSLNTDQNSAFHNRLKMLGKRVNGQDHATLSQGTFVKYLLTLISKNPEEDLLNLKNNVSLKSIVDLPLRNYFIENNDTIILKIIKNLFNGLKNAFPELWENANNNILWKTTGFGAVIKSFNQIYQVGDANNDLTENFFTQIFINFRQYLEQIGLTLTSEDFTSNEQQQKKLSKILIESLNSFVYDENFSR